MIKEDRSFGVVPLFKNKFLLIQHQAGHWAFPKGHQEEGETREEAALRELNEEAGIECELLNLATVKEEYIFTDIDKKLCHKTVEYFIGKTKTSKVVIQKEEIADYKWATFKEALKRITFKEGRQTLKKAQEYLDTLDVVK